MSSPQSPWPERCLGELCAPDRGITYGIVKVGDYVSGGVPVIRGGDIRHNGIDFNDDKRVSEEVSGQFQRTILRGGEIVLNLIAEPGHCAVVPPSMQGFNVSRDVAVIPLGPEVNHQFVKYVLQSPRIVSWLTTRLQGSVTQKINLATLRDVPVPLPPTWEQAAIAEVLGALDDNIEANDRTRCSGVALLQILFSELTAPALAQIAEGEPLPPGWRLDRLESVLDVLETGSRPRGGVSGYSDGVPSLGAESVLGLALYDFSKTKYVPHEFFKEMRRGLVQDHDVLLYKDGGRPGEFEPHVSLLGEGFPFPQFCINEHVYRLRAAAPLSQEFLFFWLSSDPVLEEMRRRGTGVAIPGLNSTAVKDLPIALPPSGVINKFTAIAEPVVLLALKSSRESRVLAQLRDVLLPKLLSGELRVRDAEDLVEEAV